MSGENLVTQASPSAGEVNSTDLTPKEKHREYMRAYMRTYRKRRKLDAKDAEAFTKAWGSAEPESSPSGPPDAA